MMIKERIGAPKNLSFTEIMTIILISLSPYRILSKISRHAGRVSRMSLESLRVAHGLNTPLGGRLYISSALSFSAKDVGLTPKRLSGLFAISFPNCSKLYHDSITILNRSQDSFLINTLPLPVRMRLLFGGEVQRMGDLPGSHSNSLALFGICLWQRIINFLNAVIIIQAK